MFLLFWNWIPPQPPHGKIERKQTRHWWVFAKKLEQKKNILCKETRTKKTFYVLVVLQQKNGPPPPSPSASRHTMRLCLQSLQRKSRWHPVGKGSRKRGLRKADWLLLREFGPDQSTANGQLTMGSYLHLLKAITHDGKQTALSSPLPCPSCPIFCGYWFHRHLFFVSLLLSHTFSSLFFFSLFHLSFASFFFSLFLLSLVFFSYFSLFFFSLSLWSLSGLSLVFLWSLSGLSVVSLWSLSGLSLSLVSLMSPSLSLSIEGLTSACMALPMAQWFFAAGITSQWQFNEILQTPPSKDALSCTQGGCSRKT